MNIVSNCQDYAMVGVLAIVKNILNVFQIVAPILCIISLSIIFLKLVRDPDNKKLLSQIRNSIIALFMVFFEPVFVNVTFGMMGESTAVSACWEMAGNVNSKATYIPIDDRGKTSILYDPDVYKTGGAAGLEELIYFSQGNYSDIPFCSSGKTLANSGCGAVAFSMIASSYVNTSFTPKVVANWFCSNHFQYSDGGLEDEAIMAGNTLEHFGMSANIIFDKTNQSSKNYGTNYNSVEGSNILRAVNAGKSVMFGMPGHWSVAGPNIECSSDKIYLYNPSRPTSNGCYTPEELFNYTYNYNNRCKKTGWCGWDVAISLVGKQ